MRRRTLLGGLLAMPAIIRSPGLLMPIKPLPVQLFSVVPRYSGYDDLHVYTTSFAAALGLPETYSGFDQFASLARER